jgi:hypothetical protein
LAKIAKFLQVPKTQRKSMSKMRHTDNLISLFLLRRMSLSSSILKRKEKKKYSTWYSRVVPHHSTDHASACLTSEIRRDPVLSGVCGRT